jgi:hypothetical protein
MPSSPTLLTHLHLSRNAPVVVVWGNLRGHLTGKTKKFTAANTAWLTAVQLPSHARSSIRSRASGYT